MRRLRPGLIALFLVSAALLFATAARATPLMATGFTVGWQTVTLVSPSFSTQDVHAGAFNLNPPAGVIAYCVDIMQTISFGTLYTDYTATPLAADGVISATRKGEIAQLFHGFYTTSLTSSTNSAAFQLALWEILFEGGSALNVNGGDGANRGVTYGASPNTPAAVVTLADTWLAGLSGSTDTTGLLVYRSPQHQDLISFQPVPGPSTWVMLVAGLGLLGLAARRRPKP